MATKKKTKKASSSRVRLASLRRVHQLLQENVLESIAMVSILLNIFFLTGLIMFQHNDDFRLSVWEYANGRYCSPDTKPDITQSLYDLQCRTGQYEPFYTKSLEDYQHQLKRQAY